MAKDREDLNDTGDGNITDEYLYEVCGVESQIYGESLMRDPPENIEDDVVLESSDNSSRSFGSFRFLEEY